MAHCFDLPPLVRAGHAVGACATAALCLLATPGAAAAVPGPATDAQILAGNAFLSSGTVEVGSRANGSFGSSVAPPAGYHANDPSGRLGFRVDRNHDGWGVGSDDGDFFVPGVPYEGWGVQAGNGGTARWNHVQGTAIPGGYGSAAATAGDATATWESTAPVDGVAVRQVTSVTAGSATIAVDVTLTNTTAAPLADLTYVRAIDSDSCALVAAASCDADGDGRRDTGHVAGTHNTVLGQVAAGDPTSAVSASQTDGSYLELRTDAAGSLAAIATAGVCRTPAGLAGFAATPPAVTGCPMSTTKGAHVFGDTLVYLLVRTPALAPGASRNFRLSYLLTAAAARAPQTITFPAAGDTALAAGRLALRATASSGLAVTFSSQTTDVCTVRAATVTLLAAGTCTITASQAGNGSHLPATPVTRSFTVTRNPQTITFAAPGATLRPAGTAHLAGSASSGLAVGYTSLTPAVCTVRGADVTLVTAGTCTIAADQPGAATFAPAPQVTRSFTVLDAPADLTSSGSGGTAQRVTLTVPDGGSATLLDVNGQPTTTVTVRGQGRYTISGDTGTFTPEAGFSGTATPVTYRISDAASNTSTARYTPTVLRAGGGMPGTGTQIVLVAGGGALVVGVGMVLILVALRRRGVIG